MRSLYDSNPGFKHYVDACCKKHKCDIETAFTFSWVKNAAEYYVDAEKRKGTVTIGEEADLGECK